MLQTFLVRSFWFVLLLMLQALVFNQLRFVGYATPMPYVYFLLILPHGTARWVYVVLGFALGFAVDIFSNTIGAAAAAMTLVGLLTPHLLEMFTPEDKLDEEFNPSARTMQWPRFLKYAGVASLLHTTVFFFLESFSFLNPHLLSINIVGSWLLSLLFVAAIERIRISREKPTR